MSPRSGLLSLVGFIAAALLVAALLAASNVTLHDVGRLLSRADPAAIAVLLGATALHVFLAAEKWRLVEGRLGQHPPLRAEAFAYSALGTAAGQVLPISLANAAVRGLGNRFRRGESGARGAIGSLWEQSFDLLVVLLLAPPAAVALAAGDASWFLILAPAMLLIGILALGPSASWLRRLAEGNRNGRLARAGRAAAGSGLLDSRLSLHLYGLSICRVAVLWIMAIAVSLAIAPSVPLLDLAVVLPFAVLASVLSMLPAGLGANEWSFAATLSVLGTPMAVAVGWTVVNRILVAQASLLIGLFGLLLLRLTPCAIPVR